MTKPKRYVVFAFDDHYPGGGWSDLVDSFDSFFAAWAVAYQQPRDNRQIVDLETGEQFSVEWNEAPPADPALVRV